MDDTKTRASRTSAVEPHPGLVPGEKNWGRFRLVRPLGSGGMGDVYEARDPHLDRRVAVKVLRQQSPEAIHRFVREARAQARVEHPGICQVFEVGESDGEPYIVMQLIRGRSLAAMAKELNLEQKLIIMAEVAAAVHEAHRSGLIHRDIKPGNIMIEEAEDGTLRPFVMDFGIARVQGDSDLTVTGSFVGTPGYSAPEQIQRELGDIDRRTDVYALGATLYSVLTGGPPFSGDTPAVIAGVLHSEPSPLRPRGIPADVETIALKCLEKDPSNRYGSARAFGDDLRRFLDGEPISASPPGFIGRIRRRIRKNRAAWLTGIVAALLLVLTLGWAGTTRWQARARERLVRDLTAEVVAIESKTRMSHMSPRHDIRPDRDRIRSAMGELADEIDRTGSIAAGPGNYALGRASLALDDVDRARRFFEVAWNADYRTPEVSNAMGVALSLQYRRRLTEIETITDPVLRERQLQTAREELQGPAVQRMRDSLGHDAQGDSYLQALVAYHENDPDAALAHLEECRIRDPWLYEAHTLEGDILRRRGINRRDAGELESARSDFDEAIQAYDTALSVAESDPRVHVASGHVRYLMMELTQFAETDIGPWYEDGLRRAAAATEVLPGFEPALLLEARLHFRSAEGLRQRHEDPTAALTLALDASERAATTAQEPSAARKLEGRIRSSMALWHGAKGDLTAQEEALDKAAEALENVTAAQRDYVYFDSLGTVHSGRGSLLARRGEDARDAYRRAMTAHRQALALYPGSKTTMSNLYSCQFKLSALPGVENRIEILEEATAAFEQACEDDPDNFIPYYYLGRCRLALAQGGDPFSRHLGPDADLALEAYRRGHELNPEMVYFQSALGEVLLLKAKKEWDAGNDATALLDEAKNVLNQGLEINPGFAFLHLNLAWTDYFRGKYRVREGLDGREALAMAAKQAQRTLDITTHDGAVLCMGSVHRMLAEQDLLAESDPRANIEAALKHFREILARNAEHPSAHRATGRLLTLEARWLGQAGGDPQSAFEASRLEIERALEIKPDVTHFLLAEARRCQHLARWLHDRGEPVEAVIERGLEHADRSLAEDPEWPEAMAVRACLLGLGAESERLEEARGELAQALGANPHLEFEWGGCLTEENTGHGE